MAIRDGSESKLKINSSLLIFIVSFLLLASIALSVVGLLNGKKEVEIDTDRESEETQNEIQEESLTDLFQKEFSEQEGTFDEYYNNDPFKEVCAPVAGQGSAAISSYTVCVR